MSEKIPSNTNNFVRKTRKMRKGRIPHSTYANSYLDKGDFGLKAVTPARITPKQLETMRVIMKRQLQQSGYKGNLIFTRVFPQKSITKKPAEVRMGSGKGAPDHWVAIIVPGTILFELTGEIPEEVAKRVLRGISYKLPMKTLFVRRTI